ncbi:PREDICTED: pancreatic triacylglycerol lipase-like [Dufourea novaeangliae]|uniref:pancreatic triacylglycerol lipase-like n=1 Tax=Dufourea novaeangliae TaxID=178035 RepID=UPI000767B334|nr:PREDICTED: pancreatic triacylglycerol lipase-like [Dufourea novaeangliae]
MKTFVVVTCLLVCGANCVPITEEAEKEINDIIHSSSTVLNLETLQATQFDMPEHVFFHLYTKYNTEVSQPLNPNDTAGLRNTYFDARKPTKIITHGYQDSDMDEAVTAIRDAFLKHGDYNVITVDWGSIAKKNYITASDQVLPVGKYLASLISFLQTQGMSLDQLTLVGHSLGAHVVGLAGHNVGGNVKFIVALDPALPNFPHRNDDNKLRRIDAKYVLVIHTNGGGFGYETTIGHIDFYPNGGSLQPGCLSNAQVACSHSRSHQYYAESINSARGFWAVQCNNQYDFYNGECKSHAKVLMGGVEPDYRATGVYYLETNSKAPFAKGPM